MPVWIKQGVMGDLCPELQKELGKVIDLYEKCGLGSFYITSKREGNHQGNSFHYIGHAVDFGKALVHVPREEIKKVIGKDFDLVEERTHFHLEYDPK